MQSASSQSREGFSFHAELHEHLLKKKKKLSAQTRSPKPYPLLMPCSTGFSSTILPHPIYVTAPSSASGNPYSPKPTVIPIPVSCFMPAPASLQSPAELNGVCRHQGSRVCSVQLSSAQLGCQLYKLTV